MYPATGSRLVFGPEAGADGSFPERHFESPDDDKAVFLGIGPGNSHVPVTKPPTLADLNFASFDSQGWSARHEPVPHRGHILTPGLVIDTGAVSAPLPQPTAILQSQWIPFNEQPSSAVSWQPPQPDFNIDDDSDSVQSTNESPDEFYHPPLAWPPPQKPRRRRSHRVGKPRSAPVTAVINHTKARPERPYIPDFDYNQDWSDPPDVAAAFLSQPNFDPTSAGAEIEIAFRGRSSPSKVDSKRIAHKLSEKTRRNRLTIAIREIQKLLPSEGTGEGQSPSQPPKDADFVVRPGVPSSKLDIVEMAVGFIKDLKEKNKEMARRLKEAEQKLDECQCWRGREGSPPDSAASPLAEDDTV